MENFTIEKMEIKRFNALLVRTIASALLLGVLIWETFCLDTSSKGFIGGIWYIFVFAVLLFVVVHRLEFSELKILYNTEADAV